MPSTPTRESHPVTSAPDALSARAMTQVVAMRPHERLLLLSGCSLRELARRVGTTHTRLSAIFADATAFGRLSPEWAARLATAVEATASDIDALFGIRRDGSSTAFAVSAAATTDGGPPRGPRRASATRRSA